MVDKFSCHNNFQISVPLCYIHNSIEKSQQHTIFSVADILNKVSVFAQNVFMSLSLINPLKIEEYQSLIEERCISRTRPCYKKQLYFPMFKQESIPSDSFP